MNRSAIDTRISKRQQALLAHIRNKGSGQVDLLAKSFKVTPQTIRRDLNVLCNLRLLLRIHGGAVAPGGVAESEQLVNLDYQTRSLLGAEAKDEIGKLAAAIVPNDASLFINIGTTTERVAEHLVDHLGLLVITNNINIANTLRRCRPIKVMTAGGLVRYEDGGIVGDATEEFVNQFKVDYAIIGCSAIEPDGTLLDFDVREVKVTRAIIHNARSVILVSDHLKFARKAPVRLGSISQVNYFVTDKPPALNFMEVCHHSGVEVLTAGSERGN
ncbi:MAG: DeoR/GlpR family DNA-binding transcription regulator [bacterium]